MEVRKQPYRRQHLGQMFHLRQQWMPAWLVVPLLARYAAGAVMLYRVAQAPGECGRMSIPA